METAKTCLEKNKSPKGCQKSSVIKYLCVAYLNLSDFWQLSHKRTGDSQSYPVCEDFKVIFLAYRFKVV